MATPVQRRVILMADDDAEDCTLLADALHKIGADCDLHFVRNGEELWDYLRREGEYEDPRIAPTPDLIILDLKMPRKDGRETIRELKTDPCWRRIPIIALTTSTSTTDIQFCYDAGVNSYLAKPSTFHELVEIAKILVNYWFKTVILPQKENHGRKTS